MIGKNIKAVASETLSKRYDPRFVIVQMDIGEILDDAQGYGYKSKPNAYRGYAYKEKQAVKRRRQQEEFKNEK